MVDHLLDLMASDPQYKYFMLDGQTIVLDDYLEMRPERQAELSKLVRRGRLLIGPWHVLPDEFLVSPEAIIRNLLQGERTARRFGPKMMVGYIPDPFGHIGQMPQILRGFGIGTASLQRGLSVEPCELWWRSPDGSQVFLAYLRDGYGNAYQLPTARPEDMASAVSRLRDNLLPHAAASHLLLMHGMDHMEAVPETNAAVRSTNKRLDGDELVHSTLPHYLEAVLAEIDQTATPLPVVSGELRSSRRHHLLPGVLSTRVWIKQRNHTCEVLLEKWAEPFSTFAGVLFGDLQLPLKNKSSRPASASSDLAPPAERLSQPAQLIRQAWRYLMECHPHDSICGCSIDQVHEEMRPRFDQVEQIGEEITRQSLEALAAATDTRPAEASGNPFASIVVYNPLPGPRTDLVQLALYLPVAPEEIEIVDASGCAVPVLPGAAVQNEIASMVLDHAGLLGLLSNVDGGKVTGIAPLNNFAIQSVELERRGSTLLIQVGLAESAQADASAMAQALASLPAVLADDSIERFLVHVHTTATQVSFVARDVPGIGFRTYWVRLAGAGLDGAAHPLAEPAAIENEFFSLAASPVDGSLTLTDKRSGLAFHGLNRFFDGGDAGDEYTYSPPDDDHLVTATLRSMKIETSPVRQSLIIELSLAAPAGLAAGRRARSARVLPIVVKTRASLSPHIPRLDIATEVDNPCTDHRLRVHFPAPFGVDQASYDGHFEIVRRPLGIPESDPTWAEQPRPEQPQRAFTAITGPASGMTAGLLVASHGLREAEVLHADQGPAEIALTLLRCTGWLSRDDLSNRHGHAGPGLATPGAQMLGRWTFHYSVIPLAQLDGPEDFLSGCRHAYDFNTPLRGIATGLHAGPLPGSMHLLQARPDAFAISAIKAAENGDGWLVRGYNLTAAPVQVTLVLGQAWQRAWLANLAEENVAELQPGPAGSVQFKAGGNAIVTVKFI